MRKICLEETEVAEMIQVYQDISKSAQLAKSYVDKGNRELFEQAKNAFYSHVNRCRKIVPEAIHNAFDGERLIAEEEKIFKQGK